MPNFQRWDLKYYYQIHCQKQRRLGNTPLSYAAFVNRLKKMNLHDAIHTPRVEYQVRDTNKTPIQDAIRRRQINKEENIQILDLRELERIENKYSKKNRIQIPKPKRTLWDRFISLFR